MIDWALNFLKDYYSPSATFYYVWAFTGAHFLISESWSKGKKFNADANIGESLLFSILAVFAGVIAAAMAPFAVLFIPLQIIYFVTMKISKMTSKLNK